MLHPSSPLIPYYPPDFTSDPNGKRQAWEAVVKIPFIDADVLLETVEQVLEKDKEGGRLLTPGERRRNARGKHHLYVPKGGDVEGRAKKAPSPKKARKPAAKGQQRVAKTEA
jgi:5'-3' exoribonuclease 1